MSKKRRPFTASSKQIQKLRLDSDRQNIQSRAFSHFSAKSVARRFNGEKTQNAWICAGSAHLPEGASDDLGCLFKSVVNLKSLRTTVFLGFQHKFQGFMKPLKSRLESYEAVFPHHFFSEFWSKCQIFKKTSSDSKRSEDMTSASVLTWSASLWNLWTKT